MHNSQCSRDKKCPMVAAGLYSEGWVLITISAKVAAVLILTHWFEKAGSIVASKGDEEGASLHPSSMAAVYKGLQIPGYGGVSRKPPLH